jgi:hypothetical protein
LTRWALGVGVGVGVSAATARGGRKNKTGKRRTSAPARKKNTYVPPFFNIFLSAFLGVSRQKDFENTGNFFQYVSKKITGEIFFGGDIFSGWIFEFFFFRLFSLRWLGASR